VGAFVALVLAQADGVEWLNSYDEAVSRAAETHQPILVYEFHPQ